MISSHHTLTKMHVSDGQGKECNRDDYPNNVLHESLRSEVSDSIYQEPVLRPHHQIKPNVAVFCSFFNTLGVSVRKNG
jgi:hypothetical protein